MIRIAEMVTTKSILREWTWKRDHSIMIPQKTVLKIIIIQILITNLNIDKSLAINLNRMIKNLLDLETWGTLKGKLIRVVIMAKEWTQRKADPEKAIVDMKKEDRAVKTKWKVNLIIRILFRMLNKILINLKKTKVTNILKKRNKMRVIIF